MEAQMKRLIAVSLLFFGLNCPVYGQAAQGKLVLHPTVVVHSCLYGAAWSITNIRQDLPDNTNLMVGLGCRGAGKWVEVMLQRQLSGDGQHKWFADFRTSAAVGRCGAFLELAPFLTGRGLYNYTSLECKMSPRLKAGAETENIWRPGLPAALGAGPRLTVVLDPNPKRTLAVSAAYQLRNQDDVVRVYLVFHPQF